MEYIRVHLEVFSQWGEKRGSINREGGESYLVLLKLLINRDVNMSVFVRFWERQKVTVSVRKVLFFFIPAIK